MTVSLPWPTTTGQLLAWGQVVLVWAIAAYAASADTTDQRSSRRAARMPRGIGSEPRTVWAGLGGAAVVALAPGFAATDLLARLVLAIGLCALVLALPFVRGRLVWSETGALSIAVWEVAANAVFALFAGVVIAVSDLTVVAPVLAVPGTDGRLAAVCVAMAAAVFLCRGGTYVVRSVLDTAGAVPRR